MGNLLTKKRPHAEPPDAEQLAEAKRLVMEAKQRRDAAAAKMEAQLAIEKSNNVDLKGFQNVMEAKQRRDAAAAIVEAQRTIARSNNIELQAFQNVMEAKQRRNAAAAKMEAHLAIEKSNNVDLKEFLKEELSNTTTELERAEAQLAGEKAQLSAEVDRAEAQLSVELERAEAQLAVEKAQLAVRETKAAQHINQNEATRLLHLSEEDLERAKQRLHKTDLVVLQFQKDRIPTSSIFLYLEVVSKF